MKKNRFLVDDLALSRHFLVDDDETLTLLILNLLIFLDTLVDGRKSFTNEKKIILPSHTSYIYKDFNEVFKIKIQKIKWKEQFLFLPPCAPYYRREPQPLLMLSTVRPLGRAIDVANAGCSEIPPSPPTDTRLQHG